MTKRLQMFESIVTSLRVAGITSLAFIAYNHGEHYRRITVGLSFGSMAIGLGLWIWQGAILSVEIALGDTGAYKEWDTIRPAIDKLKLHPMLVAAWMPVSLLYVAILHAWISRLKD